MVKIRHKQNHLGSLVKFDHKMRYENANKIKHPSTYLAIIYLKTIYKKIWRLIFPKFFFFVFFLFWVMMKKKKLKNNFILAFFHSKIVLHSKKFHHFHWLSAKQCGAQVDEKSHKAKQTNKHTINQSHMIMIMIMMRELHCR